MNINQTQLSNDEQELLKLVLDFRLKTGSTIVCFNDMLKSFYVDLDLTIPRESKKEQFDPSTLNAVRQDLENQLKKLNPNGRLSEDDPMSWLVVLLVSQIDSIDDIISSGYSKTRPLLGLFGSEQSSFMLPWLLRYYHGRPTVFLFLDNIMDEAKIAKKGREVVLVTTFIHEMFHAWNYCASSTVTTYANSGKRDPIIEEAMVEFCTLYFLNKISKVHAQFKPILEWAEESVKDKQYGIGSLAAYGFGYYLHSMVKNKKAKQMLEDYPYRSQLLTEFPKIHQALGLAYPFGRESDVFDMFYQIICPKVIGHVWMNKEVKNIIKPTKDEVRLESAFKKKFMHEKALRIVESRDALSIEFCHHNQWHPLYDELFKEVVLLKDYVFATPCPDGLKFILPLRKFTDNLPLCDEDFTKFRDCIYTHTLLTDCTFLFKDYQDIHIRKFLRARLDDKYYRFSFDCAKNESCLRHDGFDACTKPTKDLDHWQFKAMRNHNCLLLDGQNRQPVYWSAKWKDSEKADASVFERAKQGDASAQFRLGQMHQEGYWVLKDDVKAFEWFQMAAEQGYIKAQMQLGEMYERGKLVQHDDPKAFEWYLKAAEQGCAQAQYDIGTKYQNGNGVKKDETEAMKWYIMSANQKDSRAIRTMEQLAEQGNPIAKEWCQKAEDQKQKRYLEKQAKSGNKDAQYELGKAYEQGLYGECVDEEKATRWYAQAAEKGSEDALKGLAKLAGKGVPDALDALVKLGKGGLEARYQLGALYQEGKGVPKDYSEASKWYGKAANKLDKAMDALVRLVTEGSADALNTLEELGNNNNINAQYWLGKLYHEGKGIPTDEAKALKWLDFAAQQGHKDAESLYRQISS